MSKMKRGPRYKVLLGLAVVLLVTGYMVFFRKGALVVDLPGVRVMDPPVVVKDFALKDHGGRDFTRQNLLGGWTLLSIGFVYCPDICPTTLSDLAAAYRELEQNGMQEGLKVVFVSVDPYRDSLELLGKYVGFFHPSFVGVTGDPAAVKKMADSLDLNYVYSDPEDNTIIKDVLTRPSFDDYLVVHSTSVLLIDPDGEIVVRMRPPFIPERVASVLRTVWNHYER